ncbi:dentin sialophosphoprotein-like [Paramacrobiotus metropolitanus]|uniref:dentin sialophosphoprotein-like n=1 Tax=Paramacrobiotus metropolitanus TaxID=2943436 RepID=UPI002445E926|nr:dentin sialophosphoprotein-like [Paramacrobiotus metropolitanus]
MFGSLVIVFPTKHTGGELILRHGGKEWTFDSAKELAAVTEPAIGYVAFFSDVEHEVAVVQSGYRVTWTYNLYFGESPVSPPEAMITNVVANREHTFKAGLEQLLADPTFLPKGGLVGFGLQHKYPVNAETDLRTVMECLKGSDALVSKVCQELSLPIKPKMLTEAYGYSGDERPEMAGGHFFKPEMSTNVDGKSDDEETSEDFDWTESSAEDDGDSDGSENTAEGAGDSDESENENTKHAGDSINEYSAEDAGDSDESENEDTKHSGDSVNENSVEDDGDSDGSEDEDKKYSKDITSNDSVEDDRNSIRIENGDIKRSKDSINGNNVKADRNSDLIGNKNGDTKQSKDGINENSVEYDESADEYKNYLKDVTSKNSVDDGDADGSKNGDIKHSKASINGNNVKVGRV